MITTRKPGSLAAIAAVAALLLAGCSPAVREAPPVPEVAEEAAPSAPAPAPEETAPEAAPEVEESAAQGYQEIFDEYSARLVAECPELAMTECAELSTEGVSKMAEYMFAAKGTDGQMATYEEWAGKLMDVYMSSVQ